MLLNFCDLFDQQVLNNPEATAAIYEDQLLTYRELDILSLQVAHFFKENHFQPETIIALSLFNGFYLLAGMLGIWHAGCVYLPLDPTYPSDRMHLMLNDAHPALLLTDHNLHLPYKTVLINDICNLDKPLSFNKSLSNHPIQPHHLAYIMYTSGSTGTPKGIQIEHRALTHAATVYQYNHPQPLISLMSGSISFDASLLVIIHTLTAGGTICLPNNTETTNCKKIIHMIHAHQINYTLCTPSFYSILLNYRMNMPSLKLIALGGDQIPLELPKLHAQLAPNASLYNVYGPTEYAVGATSAQIYDATTQQIYPISIGKPLPHTTIYILNQQQQLVESHMKGEIYIGGNGLARGYLNQESLSKEKFLLLCGFCTDSTERLYRTGDFGRVLSDGNIEFLGRIDHQVKIRGYRIEFGEIEHHIRQHPLINEAIVSVDKQKNPHRLIAYFTSRNPDMTALQAKRFLENKLPRYMIPSEWIQIDHWLLGPNGKIDRNLLPKASPSSKLTLALPEPENTIYIIWQKILGYSDFKVTDNFFDLGGDSLQVIEMQKLLEQQLHYSIHLADLFQYPTISTLACHLSNKKPPISMIVISEIPTKRKNSFLQFKNLKNRT